jgi:hypothetical protein
VRTLLRTLSVAALAATAIGVAAGPASARLLASGGVYGYNAVAPVTCRYMDAWGTLRAEVPPPTAYAFNRTAGAANDWQQVRYRHHFMDVRTGAELGRTGWSGWAWARDDVAAAWTGSTMQSYGWRAVFRVETRIEFYGRSGAYEGWTAHTADTYRLHRGYTTYPALGDSCASV